jgi:hypothetical protein
MRHDQALVIKEASADQAFIGRRIDTDDQIIAVFHGIDLSILGDDLKLDGRICQRKPRADAAERDMGEDDRDAHPQPAARRRGTQDDGLARFRDFGKRPAGEGVLRPEGRT